MKNKKTAIIIIGALVILGMLLTLSMMKFFPSHPFGKCPNQDTDILVTGPVICPNQANFWEYLRDDLKFMDR